MNEGIKEIDRRNFIGGAVAATTLATLLTSGETAEGAYRFLSSAMTQDILENQKLVAIDSLKESILDDPRMDYLRVHATHLGKESQMYIPGVQELQRMMGKSEPQLNELTSRIRVGDSGLFIFADVDGQNRRTQRLYVVLKNKSDEAQFVKAYQVSMSEMGFGNKTDSRQTPLGLHTIQSGKRGIFGEVVSGLNKHKDLFTHLKYNGEDHWFVKGFGERSPHEENNDVAEVVTDQYLLEGPQTVPSRGIRIHGTNRSGMMLPDGTWKSFLGGARGSSGCIRMSNTDVRDLGLSNYISWPESADERNAKRDGTLVMIHATQRAKNAHEF